jgi:hypothetical protein
MLSKPHFEILVKPLIDEYPGLPGRPSYGPERILAIYESFKWMNEQQFKSLIARCFQSERQAPMARDLKRIWSEIQDEEYEKQKRQEKQEREQREAHGGASQDKIREILAPLANKGFQIK